MSIKPLSADWPGTTRLLGPSNRSHIKGHYLRLDARGRLGRFWHDAPVTHLNSYIEALDLDDGVFLGCFPDQTLRALAEARPMGPGGQTWEAVVSVETGWQDLGLGTWLLGRAIERARQQGAFRIFMKASIDNTAAKKVALRFGASLSIVDGESIAKIDLRGLRFDSPATGLWPAQPDQSKHLN